MNSLKKLYIDIDCHLQNDNKPSQYLEHISSESLFKKYPFNMLYKLKQTKQSPEHHPEGNVWNHTMLVIDEAADLKYRSKDAAAFMWTAFLHDIGKPDTTRMRKGRITAYDHDIAGEKLARTFLSEFIDDKDFIKSVTSLIRWHMQILFVVNNLPFADIRTMKKQIDVNEVALFGLCDRLGRLNPDRKQEENNIKIFLRKCNIIHSNEKMERK